MAWTQQQLNGNSSEGFMRVQVTTGQEYIPVAGATVRVTKNINDKTQTYFEGVTDIDGIADNIRLPAQPLIFSEFPQSAVPVSIGYDILVEHPDYYTAQIPGATIFAGVKSIQPVNLTPRFS